MACGEPPAKSTHFCNVADGAVMGRLLLSARVGPKRNSAVRRSRPPTYPGLRESGGGPELCRGWVRKIVTAGVAPPNGSREAMSVLESRVDFRDRGSEGGCLQMVVQFFTNAYVRGGASGAAPGGFPPGVVRTLTLVKLREQLPCFERHSVDPVLEYAAASACSPGVGSWCWGGVDAGVADRVFRGAE